MSFWKTACLITLAILCEVQVLARPNLQDEVEGSGNEVPVTAPPPPKKMEEVAEGGVQTTSLPQEEKVPAPAAAEEGDILDVIRSVSLQYPPGLYAPPFYVPLSYACLPGDVIVLEVIIDTDLAKKLRVFSKTKYCQVADSRLTYEHLDLPEMVTYRPDALNRHSVNIYNAVVSVWIVSEIEYHSQRNFKEMKKFALVSQEYPLEFKQPFARPRRKDLQISRSCLSWEADMLLFISVDSSLQCIPEMDGFQLAYFPIPLSLTRRGVSRRVGEVQDPYLRRYFRKEKNHPRYTITFLLFIKNYCKGPLCSIYHRKEFHTNAYITPLIFMTSEGKIHFQVTQEDGKYRSMLNHFILPKYEWFRMTVTMNGVHWSLTLNYKNFTRTHMAGDRAPFPDPVHYSDNEGLAYLGGSNVVPAFPGFIADSRLWRGLSQNPKKIEHPNSTHPVRWLELEQHHQACDSLHTRLFWAFQSYSVVIKSYQRRVTCPSFEVYIRSFNELQKFCLARTKVSVPKQLKFVYGALRKVVTVTHNFDIEAKGLLGSMLMAEAEKTLKMNGLDKYDDLLNLLKQASCFDHNEAAAMLGAMYSAGLRKRKDTRKGMMYTLMAAQEGNIMAQCSLGFMHLYGTGGLDQDFDYAYFYLIEVAAQAVKSKEKHGAGSVTTEMVRLTDTAQLQYHSGEKGDYFQWMKFQASKGMTDAQARMGRILYWGSGGVKRNLQAATKYYERTAKAAPKNAVALFDYGVVLLRGQGTEKNITKALEQLNKSAALGHAPAFTAIGWYKLNIEKDYEAAAKYFEKGDQGGHRDAAHNLAYMYSRGIYPGKGEEKMTAFKYYKRAADKGHSDSSVMLAKLYKEGVENEMEADSEQAAKWAYRVAIEHEEFGMLLRKGLEAFLSTSWDVSVLYYLMAAEAGLEVAQFNLAYLCEENYEGVADRYFQSGCQWKYYEMASLSPKPHAATLLKMGEYYWYGHGDNRDTDLAIGYYVLAARHRVPEAIFNLAYISEMGMQIPQQHLKSLGVKKLVYQSSNTEEVAKELYRICRDHNSGEAYIPCGLALLRLNVAQTYRAHPYACQLSTCAIAAGLIGLVVLLVMSHYAKQRKEEERQQATSLYHALQNGNMNDAPDQNDGSRQSGTGGAGEGHHHHPPPPPRRRVMVNSQLAETDETVRVDHHQGNSPDISAHGGSSFEAGPTSGVISGTGDVSNLTAPTVLDSDDPLIQAKVARLPEAVVLEEDTDLHLRTFGASDDEMEEMPTV
ncbi:protein sel-1 homolog 3-like isoform X2 [Apostichopus japonicus]|uniref:protein sel-1 homolog 3-like isoform X2 n=1 Tax=Stichopus japonicus TaxID=307972 RepID=UPI003AB722A9